MTVERLIQSAASIVVPCDIQRFAQNQREHWRGKARSNKQARGLGYIAWLKAGKPVVRMPATVHVLVRRPRRLDKINVPGALKSIVDGIVGDGMGLNDSQLDIAVPIDFETGHGWKGREEVVLTFRSAARDQDHHQGAKSHKGPRRKAGA